MEKPNYPTDLHRKAIEKITNHFHGQHDVDTILLVNSLARGKGARESDIDMAILVDPGADFQTISNLQTFWDRVLETDRALVAFRNSNQFAHIHLDIIDGQFIEEPWEDGTDANYFEVEIGNRLCYSKALAGAGEYFKTLQSRWLPYYTNDMQVKRLALSKKSCLYELEHIQLLVKRELYFHAHDRLNVSFRKFLQTLFIYHKTYPISYNKWIKEQIESMLNLPELYAELKTIFSVHQFESKELCEKAEIIKNLLQRYT